MTNFVFLISGSGMAGSEEEQQQVMAAWGQWYGTMGEAVVDGGNPFGGAKSVDSSGIHDGVPEAQASGYLVVKADSMDAAIKMAEACPEIPRGGTVSVYETFVIPGM